MVPWRRLTRRGRAWLPLAWVGFCVAAAEGPSMAPRMASLAQEGGMDRGVVVHAGCGDGALLAALGQAGTALVQGLDTSPGRVRAARERIRALGLYGRVSASAYDGSRLPYVDHLVNTLIVSPAAASVPRAEVLRVLAPRGQALFLRDDLSIADRARKDVPGDIDEWTHFLYDAGGNPVSRDRVVGPPRRVQWLEDPPHARSHEHTPSTEAMVSAQGRVFYVADLAPIDSLLEGADWRLVARDAFNGTLLWQRPLPEWFPHIWGWTSSPIQLQRRLVAVGDRVYATLGYDAHVSVLDARTGETVRECAGTEGTEEILWHRDTLLLCIREVNPTRTEPLRQWALLAKADAAGVRTRDLLDPLQKGLRQAENAAGVAVVALDPETGARRWEVSGDEVAGLRPLSLRASGDAVVYQKGGEVVCRDLATGAARWQGQAGTLRTLGNNQVIGFSRETVRALRLDNGELLWSAEPLLVDVRDCFVIDGSVWLGGFKAWQGRTDGKRGPAWGPYFVTQRAGDTGEVLRHIEPEGPGHHHRCFQGKATSRYILANRRGVEFFDLETGDLRWHSWVRGVCRYGVMPANGLLYVPPHACGCYVTAKLAGFFALASGPDRAEPLPATEAAPERGPAYGPGLGEGPAGGTPAATADSWPTYRGDMRRSGAGASRLPAAPTTMVWEARLPGRPTPPVVAGGRVFVAIPEVHEVVALDAGSGASLWRFTAGGRVDSPPTAVGDRILFGCADGTVTSLRAEDGVLAWRVRAARGDRRIVVRGQLESSSPVHGSVLVRDGIAYVLAGRSSYLDGGIDLCRIRTHTGEILSRTPAYSPDPETGRQPDQYGPNTMPGALSDILAADDTSVYLRDLVFDADGAPRTEGTPHLLTITGFLDDTWPHRSYWIHGTHVSIATGCSGREKDLVYGRLLVFDDQRLCGYGRQTVHWSNQLEDGPYRLFARDRTTGAAAWSKPIDVQARALLLAGDVLCAAGPAAQPGTAPAIPVPGQPPVLVTWTVADGSERTRAPLPAAPVFDGMACAGGRLIVALDDGRVTAWAAR
ncbi:MAG: PQQ-binding-like beta-propeller repeat protein [Lentisphaeria bacterium]|nr:PQQ-binding-like beta-propeller repeat protein [Lentisphaeria bacterium]